MRCTLPKTVLLFFGISIIVHLILVFHDTNNRVHFEALADFRSSRISTRNRSRTCTPMYNLSYVKIHKTGSGSFHNKLVRLAIERGLFIALPKCAGTPMNFHVFPALPHGKFLHPHPTNARFHGYNMFLDHAVFNRDVQRDYLSADATFITQLRHPYGQSYSVTEHFLHGRPFESYLAKNDEAVIKLRGCYAKDTIVSLNRNFQAYTLGYTKTQYNNLTDFDLYLEYLDHALDFVSILEMKDESHVLLKRRFCWSVKDILDLHTHRGVFSTNQTAAVNIPDDLLKLHKRWSPLDYKLYKHFRQKLEDDIKLQTEDFHEEVREYKRLNIEFSHFCRDMCLSFKGVDSRNITLIQQKLNHSREIPASKFNPAFSISYTDCLLSMAQEKSLQNVLKFFYYSDACGDSAQMKQYGLSESLCDKRRHVFPGFDIEYFRRKVLVTEHCVTLDYMDYQIREDI